MEEQRLSTIEEMNNNQMAEALDLFTELVEAVQGINYELVSIKKRMNDGLIVYPCAE
jgi:hypothetical protein